MYLLLLKKALPFTLTFIFGALLSGLTGLFMGSERKTEMASLRYQWSMGDSRGHGHCHMRRRNLVAETKALNILDVPVARWPRGLEADNDYAMVNVTFGADGRVQRVGPPVGRGVTGVKNNVIHDRAVRVAELETPTLWEAIEQAALQIQFEPETVNGVPVSVTKDVEIHFVRD